MKRKIIVITILSIITGLVILNSVKTEDIEVEKIQKEVKNSNMLTMMLETEAGTGNYEEVKQSEWPQDGYVFNKTLSKCENGSELSWDDSTKKVIFASTKADRCYIYFDIKTEPTFAEYIKDSVYTTDGVNDLYYHDRVGTYTNASEEAGDNSYRYSGADPNNYVCFGSDAATCPNDNLYRIIGLFDDDNDGTYNIKLIKNTSIGNYVWNGEYDNTWNASTQPEIYTTLNITFLETINSTWQEKIATQNWKVGGMAQDNLATAKGYYDTEIGSSSISTIYNMKIGLIYVSDYGYAAAPSNWTTELYNYEREPSTNWLYLGSDEWAISCRSDNMYDAFLVDNAGSIYGYDMTFTYAVRPSFYLESSVVLTGGTGTSSDPYRLSVD